MAPSTNDRGLNKMNVYTTPFGTAYMVKNDKVFYSPQWAQGLDFGLVFESTMTVQDYLDKIAGGLLTFAYTINPTKFK